MSCSRNNCRVIGMADEFANAQEAGGNKPSGVQIDETLLDSINLDDLRLAENTAYQKLVADCAGKHKELLAYETQYGVKAYTDNPAVIGQHLGYLRLNANMLFGYLNIYIDLLSDLQRDYATKRKELYLEAFNAPKGSASGAEKHARENTRVDESKISVIENNIQQIKNEYERYNGICMYLQSRMKEFNTERMVG